MSQPLLETIYQDIGASLVEALDEPWSEAWVAVELDAGVQTIRGYYYPQNRSADVHSFLVPGVIARQFEALRRVMQEGGGDPWCHAEFHLKPDGVFDLDFSYEVLSP